MTTPVPFEHFVLTRFNVRLAIYGHESADAWLRGRMDLFERYCLPSFVGQTRTDFRWLLFCDSESPAWLRDRLEALAGKVFEPVYVDGVFDAARASLEVRRRLDPATRHLVTTRVDNDDAVARDFVETIQQQFEAQQLEFVNLVNGSQLAEGHTYLRPYTQNPFISLIERIEPGRDPRTVFVDRHYQLAQIGPVRNVRTSHPTWLQVVHGGNVLNEVVGLRVRTGAVAPWFAADLGVATDRPVDYAAARLRGLLRIGWRLLRKPGRVLELARTVIARPAGTAS